jgi:hypothetical protein
MTNWTWFVVLYMPMIAFGILVCLLAVLAWYTAKDHHNG